MAKNTSIQWCDDTCNPTMGCDGCELYDEARQSCYAGDSHIRFGGSNPGYAPSFEQVTKFPGRMAEAALAKDLRGTDRPEKPWLSGMPRMIFVSDMSDALSEAVDFEYLKSEIIDVVTSTNGSRHRWLWLTKRPARMAEFSAWLLNQDITWPPNLWVGTSITSQGTTGRIPQLLRVGDKRTKRFLSVEPQIEALDLSKWLSQLDWIIQGGESGRQARPFNLDWAIDLLATCKANGVPYFLKQLGAKPEQAGERLNLRDSHGGDWSEWPAELRIREVPFE